LVSDGTFIQEEEEKWTVQSPETGQDCYRRQDTRPHQTNKRSIF